jgi:hypothetical protein
VIEYPDHPGVCLKIHADGGGRKREMTRQTHGLAAKTGLSEA